jgi:hypothetical protein
MAVPNAVSASFSKILPPFLRKDNEDSPSVSSSIPDIKKEAEAPKAFPSFSAISKNLPLPKLPFLTNKKGDESPYSIHSEFGQTPITENEKKRDFSPFSQVLRGAMPNNEISSLPLQSIVPKFVNDKTASNINNIQPQPIQQTIQQNTQVDRALESQSPIQSKILPAIQSMALQTSSAIQSAFDKLDLTPNLNTAKISLEGLSETASKIRSQFGTLVQSALMFGVTTLLSLSPTVLVFGGIAIAIAAITTNFLGLKTIALGIIKTFSGLFQVLRGIVEILTSIGKGISTLGTGISAIIGAIPAALKGDFSLIQTAFNTMATGLSDAAAGVVSGLSRLTDGLKDAFSGVIQIVKGLGEGVSQVVSGITIVIKSIPETVSAIVSAIKTLWKGGSEFISNLPIVPSIEFLQSLPSRVIELFDRVISSLKNAIGVIS